MFRLTKIILGQFFVLLCFFIFSSEAQAGQVPAPTLLEPKDGLVINESMPHITGLTVSGTSVHIYIDGIHVGQTKALNHDSGTANFAVQSVASLSAGKHMAWGVTEDQSGQKSNPSNILNFTIGLAMPAPTIFFPVVNASSTPEQPFIVGLAKNNSLIKVYIDNILDGEFIVENHLSGTANFAYQPKKALEKKQYLIYTTATDSKAKVSKKSNLIYYFPGKKPTISQAAKASEPGKVIEIKPIKEEKEESSVIVSPSEGTVVDGNIDQEIKEIIDEGAAAETPQTGLIDEEKQEQGKLNLNLIIFIVFLVGIIAWIFWVNRELIKEKREQEKQDK